MAIFQTYLHLQQRIADDLGNRVDLLEPLPDSKLFDSPIKLAIQSAIAKWEGEPFYFNEEHSTPLFTTVPGQEFYGEADAPAILSAPQITSLYLVYAGNRMSMTKRSWSYLQDIAGPFASGGGLPCDWAYYGGQIRLSPIPGGAWPIYSTAYARSDPDTIEDDYAWDVWTTVAFDLIRSEAKLILARETLHDPDLAAECEMALYGNPQLGTRGYVGQLKAETARRASGRIRVTRF